MITFMAFLSSVVISFLTIHNLEAEGLTVRFMLLLRPLLHWSKASIGVVARTQSELLLSFSRKKEWLSLLRVDKP